MEEDIYVGFWTLKMKCSQFELYGEATFKNARAKLFFKVEPAGQRFCSGSKNPDFVCGVDRRIRIVGSGPYPSPSDIS